MIVWQTQYYPRMSTRRLLLVVLLVGMVGTAAELLLLGHTEDVKQWVPLVALALGALLGAVALVRETPLVIRSFATVMVGYLVSSALGLYFHYRGNVEFELEMYPSRSGFELVWEALTGATPALAPGSLGLLGLIGLVYAFRHPGLPVRKVGEVDVP